MSSANFGERPESRDHLAALFNNLAAVRAVVAAVGGTLGPQGLDCMLVDQGGRVMVTNDGVTILKHMDASHPAARMIVNIAKAQDEEIGDGTTTATVIAGGLLEEAANSAAKGVPVFRIIQGIRWGLSKLQTGLNRFTESINDPGDPRLRQLAVIAARGHEDLAELVVDAACVVGKAKLAEPGFKLSDCILAMEGMENRVSKGVVIGKEPMHRQMPREISRPKVLVIDDELAPEEIEPDALATESGFRHYLRIREELAEKLAALVDEGVGLVLADRTIFPRAEQLFIDKGVVAVQRVSNRELLRAAELSGATAVKKAALSRPLPECIKYLGRADRAIVDDKRQLIHILNEAENLITICLGASTTEVLEERERMAVDAASSVQAALNGGIVPGGGAVEVLLARELAGKLKELGGLPAYGAGSLVEALKRPAAQIAANAGFNPLEKIEEIWNSPLAAPGLDCETGGIIDVLAKGILDPAAVKLHAIRSACEVAESVLRISSVIKMKPADAGGG